MANLTPLIQKGVKDTAGNYSLVALMRRNQLVLNLPRGQLEKCNLNIDSQSQGFLQEGVGRKGKERGLPGVHYFHTLKPCIVCKDDCQRGPGKLVAV